MAIDPETLSSLAREYAKDMTSIRGRRVQRLLKREFGGADCVLPARLGSGAAAVLGLSATGAALCATDGTGKQASVFKWAYADSAAVESQFDLHKDSLPELSRNSMPLARLREVARLRVPDGSIPQQARGWVAEVLGVLE
ncbi:MAG: hypothetical protein ACXWJM_06760 [Ramlibacter sp.]